MKKITLLLFSLLAVCSYGQVSINVDFTGGIPAGWTDTYANTTTQSCTGASERDNIFTAAGGSMTTSNQVAVSNGTDITYSIDYKVVDWSAATVATADGWGNAQLQYSTDDGATWITAGTIDDSNDSNSNVCSTFSVTIPGASVPASSDLKFQVLNTWVAGDYYFYIDNFVAEQVALTPPNCDSTLTATTDVSIAGDITWTAATGLPSAYDLTVGTTPGGSEILTTTDVGNVTAYNVGALTYTTTYYVTIVPKNVNGSATGCVEQTFVTEDDPFVSVDCVSGTPVNTTYCYDSNDTTQFQYVSSDGSNLRVTFNSGTIESCCDEVVILDSDGITELYRGANGGDLAGLIISSTGDNITVAVDSDGSVDCNDGGRTTWDWDITCLACTPSVVSGTTVIENCGTSTFDLEVTFSDLGDAAFLIGNASPFPFVPIVPGTFTYTLAGFPKGSPVTYAVNHSSPVCDYNSAPFQDACPLDNDECAGAITATVNPFGSCAATTAFDLTVATASPEGVGSCEGFASGELDIWYEFTTNATAGINIEVLAGASAQLELAIYDACGGTEVACDSGLTAGLNPIYGLAPSTTYILQVWRETFNSSVYEICLSDIECLPATVDTTTIIPDCGTSQFSVQVDLTDVADATGVSDGTTTYPLVGSTATAGPFATGSVQNLTVLHGATTSCNIDLGNFEYDSCPVSIDCSAGLPVNETFCYNSNDTTAFGYQSSDSSQLRVVFNSGTIESCCDELVIFDSDGVTELYRGANGGDLAGLTFISSGDIIYVAVDSDGSVDCDDGGRTTWDWDVECLACTTATITSSTIVDDCGGTDTFTVEIVVSDIGTATTITDGTNTIDITGGPGTYSTIAYAVGSPAVTLDVLHSDISCDFSLGDFEFAVCPPANDACADAVALTVNADDSCTATTSGTIAGATADGESEASCGGTEDDDVWFTFVATSTTHTIDLINVANGTTDLYHSLWEGSCGTLTNLLCSDPNSSTASGLTIGVTYTLRVYSWTSTPGQTTDFDVCIGTPPAPPANDECVDAIALTVNPDFNCGTVTAGTIESATGSGESDAACGGTEDDDVWYTFVATQTEHTIDLLNVTNGTTDLYHSLWEGTCGSLTNLLCSDPNSSTATGLTIGATYTLRVYSWTSTTGQTTDFDVCIGSTPPPPVNDTCATAIPAGVGLFGSCVTTSLDTTSATSSGAVGSCEVTPGGEVDVWYTFSTNADASAINIEVTSGTSASVEVAIYDACAGTEIACASSLSAGLNTITGLAPSTSYVLQVWNESFSAGPYDICLSFPPLCTPADITSSSVVDDCGASTFTIDVLVADEGSAGSVIDDGINPTTALAAGTITMGPYTVGDLITLNVIAADSNCDIALGTFGSSCPPANDDFANAIAIACGDTIFGDTSSATLDENDAPDGPGSADTDSPNIWYSFYGNGQTIDLDTCLDGTDYDTEIMVYTGTSGNLTWVSEGYDECDGTNSDFLAQANFVAEAGVQYWISVEGWNVGNTGTFEMSVTCTGPETFVYNMGTWLPSDPTGTTTPNDILIAAGDATMTGDTDCNSFTINPGASATVPSGASVTTAAGMSLESTSTSYSSLILDGTVSGTITYDRHVNVNGSGSTGSNDLVSAPLTGEAFNTFAAANANILNNGTLYLFGPFEKNTGSFVTWAGTETATLDAGVGYRAGTTDNGTVTFTGTAETGNVTFDLVNGGTNNEEWNLVGNPYPSYLNVQDFLLQDAGGLANFQLFDPPTAAIYGYDGSALNGWTVYNLATTTASTVMAPGQGYFVSANAANTAGFDMLYTPGMRRTGSSDDFIVGRNPELMYVSLKASTANDTFGTDIYFNNSASLGFDLGYDAALWGDTTPDFALYSHLVQENEGKSMTLQAVNTANLSTVVIPLGVNANQGEQLTFSIDDMTLPTSVNIYLEDVVENTLTLLNDSNYVITPTTALSGTGRFFLRTSEDALSTIDNNLDLLDIYTLKASHELVVSGQLLNNNTNLNLYDIQGRLVLSTKLDSALLQNRIDVSSINSGVYIVTVQNNSQEKTKKVIID